MKPVLSLEHGLAALSGEWTLAALVRRIRRMGDQRPHALNGIPNRNPLKMQALKPIV